MKNRVFLMLLALLMLSSVYADIDKITIERIKCIKVSTGLDAGARILVGGLAAIIVAGAMALGNGAVVVGTGGAAIGTVPVTYLAITTAAASAAGGAVRALEWMDKKSGGDDDLMVTLDGKKYFPTDKVYHNIYEGDVLDVNIEHEFEGSCRLQLIEQDRVSHHDNLGYLDIFSNASDSVTPGEGYRLEDVLILASELGSVYAVTYTIERKVRDGHLDRQWQICGTDFCKICENDVWCKKTSNYDLDRDKNLGDLIKCPTPLVQRGWKYYNQIWPAADVYLRVCSSPGSIDKEKHKAPKSYKWPNYSN